MSDNSPPPEKIKEQLLDGIRDKCKQHLLICRQDEEDFIKMIDGRDTLTRREWRILHQIYMRVKDL